MTERTVVVLGAGPAGLASALALARAGHRVTLLERDPAEVEGSHPCDWERRGVPHFLQPHMLIPRACKELREGFPDVYADLLVGGAGEIDLRSRLQGTEAPGDEDLRYLAVRRPVLEGALRAAVLREPGVEVRLATEVDGLVLDAGRVTGVRAGGVEVVADVVVDAMGRRSAMPGWLSDHGWSRALEQSSPCRVAYYSRYYRLRPGKTLPAGPWLLGPRGDLGYLGFVTFPGDNGTFAALLAVPAGVPVFKVLREAAVFDRALAQVPALAPWVDPETAEPLTGVLTMAGLTNTLSPGPRPVGLFTVGDALSHTDPTLAHGIAFGLVHARALAAALGAQDLEEAGEAYRVATASALQERYELASALSGQRHRGWTEGGVDLAHRNGDYALFSLAAAGAAAMVDPDVMRVFVRRMGLLDSTRVLDDDIAMQERIERIFGELLSQPRPPAGPSLQELLGA